MHRIRSGIVRSDMKKSHFLSDLCGMEVCLRMCVVYSCSVKFLPTCKLYSGDVYLVASRGKDACAARGASDWVC